MEVWQIITAITAVKLLLFPSYRSTDFEVHRNWLAITHTLPISQWYVESTSEWTLDYPPLFAWFESALSQIASFVDPEMLVVGNLEHASPATIAFQRGSVIISEGVLWGAVAYASRSWRKLQKQAAFVLIGCSAGLLLVDHIHFQYNGMLLGILLWSAVLVKEGRHLAGAALFAVLVNMKHLFAVLGPVYFVYLLRHYCRGPLAVWRFLALGGIVGGVSAVSFGPFIAMGQLPQVLGRLFPFGRGLCHAYWAANFWALYSAADKVLCAALPRLGFHLHAVKASMTGGLVGVAEYGVLPQISPSLSLGLTAVAMGPCLVATWRRPQPKSFLRALAYAGFCSFIFGYHVHEKAILHVLIPLALSALEDGRPSALGEFIFISTLGTHALLPLLFGAQEYPIKVLIVALYSLGTPPLLHRLLPPSLRRTPLLTPLQFATLWGLIPLEIYCSFLHPILLGNRLPFLPLLLTSVYCAAGLCAAWLSMAASYVQKGQAKNND